ncbi:MAG: nucleotidyltransferase family protein [Verrucomicrobia bacterium]|nr:nucleotidyltransferase family protein [Verrucomicrobiota bacterium]
MTPIQTNGEQPPGSRPNLTALILCGGRGERLRPWSDAVPKSLLPVKGKPLLAYLLDHLAGTGIRDFVLCTGYKAALFEEFASRFPGASGRLRCCDSGQVSITERLVRARAHVAGRALVCYGDTLADVDLPELIAAHERLGVEATLTVYPYRSPFGLVRFDEAGRVTAFAEKPSLPYWINIGFLLLETAALQRLDANLAFSDYLAQLARHRRLGVHPHRGRHWTANTEAEFLDLASHLEPIHSPRESYAMERS